MIFLLSLRLGQVRLALTVNSPLATTTTSAGCPGAPLPILPQLGKPLLRVVKLVTGRDMRVRHGLLFDTVVDSLESACHLLDCDLHGIQHCLNRQGNMIVLLRDNAHSLLADVLPVEVEKAHQPCEAEREGFDVLGVAERKELPLLAQPLYRHLLCALRADVECLDGISHLLRHLHRERVNHLRGNN